jgi:hypothetical protein
MQYISCIIVCLFLFALFGCLAARAAYFQVRQQNRSQCLFINHFGTLRLRIIHPKDQSNFDPKIKGNERNENAETGFKNGQERKNDPIREPLRIISSTLYTAGILHGLEGHVGRIHKAEQIDNQFRSADECQNARQQQCNGAKKVHLWITRLFLQIFQSILSSSSSSETKRRIDVKKNEKRQKNERSCVSCHS